MPNARFERRAVEDEGVGVIKTFFLVLALALSDAPALAQSAGDPVETVRAFYATDDINAVRFYAKRLRALCEKERREAKGDAGRLGFAFHVNGQDTEDKWERSLTLTALSAGASKAEVQASFTNFSPQELRYDHVKENRIWRIADVRSLKEETWQLTRILTAPLR